MSNMNRLSVAVIFGLINFSFVITLPISAQTRTLDPSGNWEGKASLNSNGNRGVKTYSIRLKFTKTGGEDSESNKRNINYRMYGFIGQAQVDSTSYLTKISDGKTPDIVEISGYKKGGLDGEYDCDEVLVTNLKAVSNSGPLKGSVSCKPSDGSFWDGEIVLYRTSKSVSKNKSTPNLGKTQGKSSGITNSSPPPSSSSDTNSPRDVIRRSVPKVFDSFFK